MGFLYRRRDSRLWWICWSDTGGERRRESTGLTELEAARQVLAELERRVAARRKLAPEAAQTVADHARAQLEARTRRGDLPGRDEAARLLEHLRWGVLGNIPLCDVRHHHVVEWMRELSERRLLDSPPARSLYMHLFRLFDDAVTGGLVAANPCRTDGDPEAEESLPDVDRLSNHLTRAELERLISDPRVDRFRRCQWAALALTGARVGEVLCLRARHYDLQRQPLGRLLVTGRWDSKQRRMEPTRSGLPREVPVHRALAAMLLEHVREVLPARLGRAVQPDDLLFPGPGGGTQQAGTTLAHLHRDLDAIGARKGNLHTLRRTFFELGRQAGASQQILRAASGEGRPGEPDVPYAVRCAEIGRIPLTWGAGEPSRPPLVAGRG